MKWIQASIKKSNNDKNNFESVCLVIPAELYVDTPGEFN